MYDLRIVVEEIKGFCDMPMHVGDYFEVRAGRIVIPDGKYMCMWALQAMMPFFPVKQRDTTEENDWIPYTKHINCPDPNGMVIYRIERIGDEEAEKQLVRKRMLVEPESCVGCNACEAACPSAGIHIESTADGFTPKVCRQCGTASCINACPTGALSKEPETKAVLVDKDACIGCGQCASVCPFGSITMVDGKPHICDLCGGEPMCVESCPSGAICFDRKGGME